MNSLNVPNTTKPKTASLNRKYAIAGFAAVALGLAALGYEIWGSKARSDQAWLEKMDLENFNQTQMEVWRWCWSIGGKLQKVGEEIGDAMTFDEKTRAFSAYTPRTCKELENLRRQTHLQKIR